eukprot:CAMPEP_0201480278 /NCGR_PEP_ID=MMETSP0151_2-20130828/4786_1 /ASSEMBLY_ACC=CAM_ASM_000257 /TAXON_ID=200890 /ORGANISM="Paramoeba atlantica, Strain 621/1 / CCAP 1560/9" /LENGTH=493 /DNA_ID=CAMNT_0047862079 /DNA_START=215 /DNA_END=1696 /DNA_ORIENTATION=+
MSTQHSIIKAVAESSHQCLLSGGKKKVEISLDLITQALDSSARSPINLAIVLDTSGSMAGAKLHHCKQALREVVDLLQEEDSMRLITFESQAKLWLRDRYGDKKLCPQARKKRFLGCLDAIQGCGGTNLQAGLQKAVDHFAECRNVSEYGRKYTNHILIFSDGHTSGSTSDILQWMEPIAQELSVKVNSVGVGLDFNEQLMNGLAKIGSGMYFFIENASKIPSFVSTALNFLTRPAAYDVTLQLEGVQGSIIQTVYGHPDFETGIRLGDLPEGRKGFVVDMLVKEPKKKSASAVNSHSFFRYKVLYRVSQDDQSFRCLRGKVRMSFTNDEGKVREGVNDSVLAKAMVLKSARFDKMVLKAIDVGDRNRALKLMNDQINELEIAVKHDTNGEALAQLLLEDAMRTKKRLEREGLSTAVKKKVHHHDHMMDHNFDGFTYVACSALEESYDQPSAPAYSSSSYESHVSVSGTTSSHPGDYGNAFDGFTYSAPSQLS